MQPSLQINLFKCVQQKAKSAVKVYAFHFSFACNSRSKTRNGATNAQLVLCYPQRRANSGGKNIILVTAKVLLFFFLSLFCFIFIETFSSILTAEENNPISPRPTRPTTISKTTRREGRATCGMAMRGVMMLFFQVLILCFQAKVGKPVLLAMLLSCLCVCMCDCLFVCCKGPTLQQLHRCTEPGNCFHESFHYTPVAPP